MERRQIIRLLSLAVVAMLATGGAAAAETWQVRAVRGTALTLVDGRWVELEDGVVLPDPSVIRTLQSGRVELTAGVHVIVVGRATAVELFTTSSDGGTVLRQYSGTVTVSAGVAAGLRIETVNLVVVPLEGTMTIRVEDGLAEIVVASGSAGSVTDRRTGQRLQLAAGDVATSGTTTGLAAASDGAGNGNAVGNDPGAATGSKNAAGNGNNGSTSNGNGDNGNGNAGNGGGDSGSNGNAGGNGNSGDNGNSGGNGNGNGNGD